MTIPHPPEGMPVLVEIPCDYGNLMVVDYRNESAAAAFRFPPVRGLRRAFVCHCMLETASGPPQASGMM
jgi:hypothetical protein